jgi:adenylate cyclase
MRTLAVIVVSIWLAVSTVYPRNIYYLAIAATFFMLGYVPYRFRLHRHAEYIKLGFSILDVALITAAIMVPPLAGLSVDWPIQTRVRGQEFLYLLLLLAEAALTFSPLRVIWTGSAIALIWSIGIQLIYARPDTTRFAEVSANGPLSDEAALRTLFDPSFVSLTSWWTQLVVTALFTLILALTVWRSRTLLFAQVQAEVTRSDLARYVSPDVADAMVARAQRDFGKPAVRVVAVMFADIVGFTSRTERLPPETVFSLLRSFQARTCHIVFRHGGTLDKFLGDGFMATFGSLADQADAAARALACAFELQDEMARWNAKRAHTGGKAVELAIGLHCGPVVVGNVGAERRVEFTVVGDVVNVASRLERASREIGGRIVVSAACLQAAGGPPPERRFERSLDIPLRGKSDPITVHVA